MRLALQQLAALAGLCASFVVAIAGDETDYGCGVDRATDAYQCFRHADLRAEGDGKRYAPLYTGGPKGVHATSYTVHADCAARTLVLKDRNGVKFGAGYFHSTPMSKQLGEALCSAPLPRKKK